MNPRGVVDALHSPARTHATSVISNRGAMTGAGSRRRLLLR